MDRITALGYYGGKAYDGTGVGPWIAGQLPRDTKCTYVEPFAGMLGILLQRRKAAREIVNDQNSEIVNWWRIIRDRGAELRAKLLDTPWSREEYARCLECESDDELERARALTVIMGQSIRSGLGSEKSSWRRRFQPQYRDMAIITDKVDALSRRMRYVNLECGDACELLERTEKECQCVIYVDPPYLHADTSQYGEFTLDRDRLEATLRKQKGRVAVSGYEDEWDCLGWRRSAKHVKATAGVVVGDEKRVYSDREEVLWMNYEPQMRGLLDL